jgi:carbonyl reductase 1
LLLNQQLYRNMGHKEKSRKDKRLQEISLLRTIPYSDHQRLI